MCEDKKIITKTLKEFNCYKEFRRNYSNPNLGNYRRNIVQKVLNGEKLSEIDNMKRIIDCAFIWRLTPEGSGFWYNLYVNVSHITLCKKSLL